MEAAASAAPEGAAREPAAGVLAGATAREQDAAQGSAPDAASSSSSSSESSSDSEDDQADQAPQGSLDEPPRGWELGGSAERSPEGRAAGAPGGGARAAAADEEEEEEEAGEGAEADEGPPPREGWLLKRLGGRGPSVLAKALVGTVAQGLFWQQRYFRLERDRLAYWERGGACHREPRRAFSLADVDEVAVHDRGLTLHFSAPQRRRQPAGPGGTLLCLAAPSSAEAEEWGGAVRRGVAELRTDLPEGWDVGAMLQGGLGSAVRLVAKTPLPEGSVAAIQRLMDRSFVCKRTQDRCGRPIPVRLEVAQVIGVQNIAAWTEYTKARARVAAAAPPEAAAEGGAQRLEPEVLTHLSCEDGLVKPLLGGVADGANERWLFHGSTPAAVQGIADSEFRVDLAGSHRGTLYGKGVYLAECCSKADEYAETAEDGLYGMLLCRTVLGRTLVDTQRRPRVAELVAGCKAGYDSVCGDRWTAVGTFREFVLYDSSQVYPAYIIRYRRVHLEQFIFAIRDLFLRGGTEEEAALWLVLHAAKVADTHPNATVRCSIPMSLSVHSAALLPMLVGCLRGGGQHEMRRLAALALGMLGEPAGAEAVEPLALCLQDAHEAVRKAAAKALGQLGGASARAVPALRARAGGDSSSAVRAAAAASLGRLGSGSQSGAAGPAASALLELLREQSPPAGPVLAAVGMLGARATPAVPALVSLLGADRDAETRCASAAALGELGGAFSASAVPALLDCLQGADEVVARAAASALGGLGSHAAPAAQALVACLERKHEFIREAVVVALGQIGTASAPAVPALTMCLHDKSKGVRRAAAVALREVGPAGTFAVPALCHCLRDGDPEVARAAKASLDRLSTYNAHGATQAEDKARKEAAGQLRRSSSRGSTSSPSAKGRAARGCRRGGSSSSFSPWEAVLPRGAGQSGRHRGSRGGGRRARASSKDAAVSDLAPEDDAAGLSEAHLRRSRRRRRKEKKEKKEKKSKKDKKDKKEARARREQQHPGRGSQAAAGGAKGGAKGPGPKAEGLAQPPATRRVQSLLLDGCEQPTPPRCPGPGGAARPADDGASAALARAGVRQPPRARRVRALLLDGDSSALGPPPSRPPPLCWASAPAAAGDRLQVSL